MKNLQDDFIEVLFSNWCGEHSFHDGKNTTGLSYVNVYTCEGEEIPMPQTENMYLYFIVRGTLRLNIMGIDRDFQKGQYLVSTIDTPDMGHIFRENDREFLAVSLEFAPGSVADVFTKLPDTMISQISGKGFEKSVIEKSDREISFQVLRILDVAYSAIEGEYIGESIRNEILFYIFCGTFGVDLFQKMCRLQSSKEIYTIYVWIRKHYKMDFSVEKLAEKCNMSVSSFHKKYKDTTGISPVQFQKQLRLAEARRLLIEGKRNVSQASEEVGYKNFSQFIREYKKVYGVSPKNDVKRMQDFS